jgi:bromodomain-containing protein 7
LFSQIPGLIYSQDDFRLVISNAKTFNPPGTIYYSEAERIEAWASDHISKAASCVIEYETDWNIEIDRDEDVNVDADEDGAAGGASAGPDTPVRRSPSVTSASVPPPNRRGRATGKKEGISETLEPDGHLPGYKDGVGIFPPGSDWAEAMLALKLKGKSRLPSSSAAMTEIFVRKTLSLEERTPANGERWASVRHRREPRLF